MVSQMRTKSYFGILMSKTVTVLIMSVLSDASIYLIEKEEGPDPDN